MLINCRWGDKAILPAGWPKESKPRKGSPRKGSRCLFPHLTEALETAGRICQLELLCFVLIIFSVFK